jgi:glycosyltransferase involved in cell wall biosynthesis
MMSEPKNIIEVIQGIDRNSGGTASFMSDLSYVLAAKQYQFSLLTKVRNVETQLPISDDVFLNKLKGDSTKLILAEIVDYVERKQIPQADALFHYHGLWLPIGRAVSAFCRRQGYPCVISPHGMLEPWALGHKRWKKKLALWLFQNRDLRDAVAFHACSHQEAENIRRLGFQQPIAVIPNGVKLPDLNESSIITPYPSTQKTALFLSRINPKKGLLMLLDAWKRCDVAGWRLVIAGNDDGDHQQEVEAKIQDLGLAQSVEVVGPLFGDDKVEAFRNADLFVLPSYSENFGIVVTEALSYQVPVLTTTGCPWQELETEGCGWWVDPTPVGIEAGLNQALKTKPEELFAMGQRGRQLVLDKYQWPAIGQKFRDFYTWLLDEGTKPDFVV